ncbi:ABC transporter ATP-binding protein [Xanthobacteraceae bacterium A53D]
MRSSAPPGPLLRVERAERHLADSQRTSHISLEAVRLERGACYALCGPSGIGKTTALEMLSLAVVPDSFGPMSVRDGDREIDVAALMRAGRQEEVARLRGRLFGYVVQTSRLLPFLTVQDNIRVAQDVAGMRDDHRISSLMARLEISQLAGAYPAALSGGQRQRVSIARALAHRPAVVLADEPTSAVDREIADLILETLVDHARSAGAAVVIITHNVDLVARFGLRPLAVESETSGGALRTRIGDASVAVEPRHSSGAEAWA